MRSSVVALLIYAYHLKFNVLTRSNYELAVILPGRVRVAVRLRPRNQEELVSDVDFADCLKRLKLRKNNWDSDTYEFDEIFTEYASQKRVYEVVAKPVVESVLSGYNGTVMAYGQMGTGKTFTVGQLGEEDTSSRGITVRSMEDILAEISPDTDSLSVSYVQIYMETIQDLLDPVTDNISIVEDPKTGDVSLPRATIVDIRNQQDFMELLKLGETHRIAANTKLNTESSRSHALLMPLVRKSKLVLVDLAGSERVQKSAFGYPPPVCGRNTPSPTLSKYLCHIYKYHYWANAKVYLGTGWQNLCAQENIRQGDILDFKLVVR
ncbi:hypothetical protein ACFE04_027751 [Oxalis oulophora]